MIQSVTTTPPATTASLWVERAPARGSAAPWSGASPEAVARRAFTCGLGRALLRGGSLLMVAAVLGCGVVTQSQLPGGARLDPNAAWALLPLLNHTETVMAGQRAEALLEPLLRARGVRQVVRPPAGPSTPDMSLAEPSHPKAQEQALAWARQHFIRYVLTGSVDEWRYKIGADGEPAVGLVLQVTDLSTNEVVWSAAGGKTGWSREALSAVAHKLVVDLLRGLPLSVPLAAAVSAPVTASPTAAVAAPAAAAASSSKQ